MMGNILSFLNIREWHTSLRISLVQMVMDWTCPYGTWVPVRNQDSEIRANDGGASEAPNAEVAIDGSGLFVCKTIHYIHSLT